MLYTGAYLRRLYSRKGQPWQGILRLSNGRTLTKVFDRKKVQSKSQAKEAFQDWIKKIESETLSDKQSLMEYIYSYISALGDTGSIEPSTVYGYYLSAKHIASGFENAKLDELTSSRIQQWEATLTNAGLSSSTVGKAHRLLKQVLKHAVAKGDLSKNPCDLVKPPKRISQNPNALDASGRDKALTMLDSLAKTPVVIASYIALFTGMRQGEICALKWRDVSLSRAEIQVRQAIGKGKGGCYLKTPKTGGSKRIIPLPSQLIVILKERFDAMAKELGSYELDNLYVCGTVTGEWLNPTVLGRSWATMSRNAGLIGTEGRRCTFHDLRHTYATLAIAGGADVKSVSSILGHANAAMTLNIYASADADAKRRAVAIVEREMARSEPKQHKPKHFAYKIAPPQREELVSSARHAAD